MPLRRGLGAVFLLSGLLYLFQLVFGFAYALDAPAWTRLYFGHFLLTVMTAMVYITSGFARTGLFEPQALIDFLAGLLTFLLLFFVASGTLVLPGLFLLYYGLRLRQGKQWKRLEI